LKSKWVRIFALKELKYNYKLEGGEKEEKGEKRSMNFIFLCIDLFVQITSSL
jgi:hypothetical protein